MKIALNTTIATKSRTGTGHYAANLAAALMQVDHEHEFVVYCSEEMSDWFADRRNGHWVRIKPIRFKSVSQRIFWEQTQLNRDLKRQGVDLLHSMAFTSPFRHSVRTVVTVHDLVFIHYPETIPLAKRLYYRPAFAHAITNAWRIITLSEKVRKEVLEHVSLPSTKVVCVPTAVGEEYSRIPPKKLIDQKCKSFDIERPYLLTVATLEPRKNLPLLIKAFAALKKKAGFCHRLVIVGKKGWLNLEESPTDVIFTGYVPQEDMPALYAGADLFLFPSLYEGFGLPPLEAFACGVPVLASEISVHKEVCSDAAIFLSPNDSEQWADAIINLLNDPLKRKELRTRGMKRLNDFSWEKTAEKTLEVYGMDEANAKN